MSADGERGIWFIDTPEATDAYGDENTSICYRFDVIRSGDTDELLPESLMSRSRIQTEDLEALRQAVSDFALRHPLLAYMVGYEVGKNGFDVSAPWQESLVSLVTLRMWMLRVGWFLLWNKTIHLSGDVYDPDRIRKYLLSVPDGVAFLGWPLDAEITVFGYKKEKDEVQTAFHHLVRWRALLGDGDATGRPYSRVRGDGDNDEKESRYRKLLGLSGPITKHDAHKRFLELIAKYHPDKVNHLAPEFQSMAEEKTKALNEADEYFRMKDDV